MPCTSPIRAYRLLNKTSSRGDVVFTLPRGEVTYEDLLLPCGKCADCRKRQAMDWSVRLQHESQMHEQNSFITLTYSDDKLPLSLSGLPTLRYEDVQLFIKRLRSHLAYEAKKGGFKCPKISYYYCGEYGDDTFRPHYHMILFGWFPSVCDRYIPPGQNFDDVIYSSDLLDKLWSKGIVSVQHVNYSACSYVAGYVNKKRKDLDNDLVKIKYGDRVLEKSFCSTKPAIGKRWFERYKYDVFPADRVVVDGVELPVPRYYFKLFSECGNFDFWFSTNKFKKDLLEDVKKNRLENLVDRSRQELFAIDEITKSKTRLFKRNKI